ncbi:hypothetical protein AB0383_20550 [Amycolatopsis sp. NPDC051373]|uniref:hypothetical protein n=1 Tax=Amycolatopsis sp. NPDC051373 TaxID=3155801 RepID=UPI00344F8C87
MSDFDRPFVPRYDDVDDCFICGQWSSWAEAWGRVFDLMMTHANVPPALAGPNASKAREA